MNNQGQKEVMQRWRIKAKRGRLRSQIPGARTRSSYKQNALTEY